MFRFLAFIFVFFFAFAHCAKAESVPVPKRKGDVSRPHRSGEGSQRDLAKRLEDINRDVEDTREKMLNIAGAIQGNERQLRVLETRIDRLEEKKKESERRLEEDRASITRLVVALERIRRTPPEAILARPESPYKNAQSAMLMRGIIPVIDRHAQTLRVNLKTLESLSRELAEERETALGISTDLKEREEKLGLLLDRRKTLYREANKDFRAHEEQAQRISLQAKSLEDLVKKLDRENGGTKKVAAAIVKPPQEPLPSSVSQPEKTQEEAFQNVIETAITLEEPGLERSARQPPQRFFAPSGKRSQLPVSGIIRTRYQQPDDLGAPSNGLHIEGRPGALVVAPMDGTIQFAGTFKRYGNLIIIEHTGGYHSLIAGAEIINVVVGQRVVTGEPLGMMSNSALAVRPKLYYELRLNGQPVSPALKFSDLG